VASPAALRPLYRRFFAVRLMQINSALTTVVVI
jgi:hypothetical protein